MRCSTLWGGDRTRFLMLIKRIRKISNVKTPLATRHPLLRSLEGSVESAVPPKTLSAEYGEWLKSGSKMKPTRWISRTYPNSSPNDLAQLGKELAATSTLVVSCMHKDIAKMADSPHYQSCYRTGFTEFTNQSKPNGENRQQILHELANPNNCIAFVRDRAGHFIFRVQILLTVDSQFQTHLVIGRPYGQQIPTYGLTLYKYLSARHSTLWNQHCPDWQRFLLEKQKTDQYGRLLLFPRTKLVSYPHPRRNYYSEYGYEFSASPINPQVLL